MNLKIRPSVFTPPNSAIATRGDTGERCEVRLVLLETCNCAGLYHDSPPAVARGLVHLAIRTNRDISKLLTIATVAAKSPHLFLLPTSRIVADPLEVCGGTVNEP